MAALLTVLAIAAGVARGIANGGRFERVLHFRPELWPVGAAGVAVQFLLRVTGIGGGWAVAIDILSGIALIWFALANIRVGGMVLVVAGLMLNMVPIVINWGMPTSLDALVRSGIVADPPPAVVDLDGPRHVATADDSLRWLGEVIAVPTKQVISFGDGLLQIGYLLVTASLLRGRIVRRDPDGDYPRRIAALGRGPVRRRGPGTHPSRLDRGIGSGPGSEP